MKDKIINKLLITIPILIVFLVIFHCVTRYAEIKSFNTYTTEDYLGNASVVCNGILITECNIRLSGEIGERDHYNRVFQVLENLGSLDRVNIYLTGNGGNAETAIAIINSMKLSRAHVTTIVIGPTYSAHSDIAMSGDTIKLTPLSTFLFHRASIYGDENKICDKFKGKTDRTQDMHEKCIDYINNFYTMDALMIESIPDALLTKAEKERVFAGFDVYITGAQMQERLDKMKRGIK